MKTVGEGFYTALGTPLDEQGAVIEKSMCAQVEQQIGCGASGLLVLGSMGMQPGVKGAECTRAVQIASAANKGRVPLFAGVMDNGIHRVMERVEALRGLDIDGVVLTAPFYFVLDNDTLKNFFIKVADASPWPVYLYDLPAVTKHKLTYPVVRDLAKHKNIMGIKSADTTMLLQMKLRGEIKPEFSSLYSGLDTMDAGYACGLIRYLDGMFATTPKNIRDMSLRLRSGDIPGASGSLANIVRLRDLMAKYGIFPSFTVTMNLLGYEGFFEPDYHMPVSGEAREALRAAMTEIGEL